jgi:hypothetical protein
MVAFTRLYYVYISSAQVVQLMLEYNIRMRAFSPEKRQRRSGTTHKLYSVIPNIIILRNSN